MNEKSKTQTAKHILFVLMIVAGAVLILLSTIAALVSTAITIGMYFPALFGLAIIVYAVLRLKKTGPVLRVRWLRIVITICLCAGLLTAAVFEVLMGVAASEKPPEEDAGFVIVLGCGIFADGRLTLSLKNRLDAAYEYLIVHEDSLCIMSGGKGGNEPVAEAEAMQRYMLSRGIGAARILTESESTSTLENIENSMRVMAQYPEQPKTVALVTSDYHVFRAMMLARQYGLEAFGIPSETTWSVALACHVREYAAIIKTVLFGGEEI